VSLAQRRMYPANHVKCSELIRLPSDRVRPGCERRHLVYGNQGSVGRIAGNLILGNIFGRRGRVGQELCLFARNVVTMPAMIVQQFGGFVPSYDVRLPLCFRCHKASRS
jgi:hypothetical protein